MQALRVVWRPHPAALGGLLFLGSVLQAVHRAAPQAMENLVYGYPQADSFPTGSPLFERSYFSQDVEQAGVGSLPLVLRDDYARHYHWNAHMRGNSEAARDHRVHGQKGEV